MQVLLNTRTTVRCAV